ncbi:hypothetical protein ACN38_g85 [Penicillium nordicum]|uniref:Uncharacterized protein n=1 Tax=Penicillium nordicum TaxID=229535 RepID=A0A0M9WKZ0_9EURO|nr:hypothetical protein ACN38_g85 [Penicillium nordicum]
MTPLMTPLSSRQLLAYQIVGSSVTTLYPTIIRTVCRISAPLRKEGCCRTYLFLSFWSAYPVQRVSMDVSWLIQVVRQQLAY